MKGEVGSNLSYSEVLVGTGSGDRTVFEVHTGSLPQRRARAHSSKSQSG